MINIKRLAIILSIALIMTSLVLPLSAIADDKGLLYGKLLTNREGGTSGAITDGNLTTSLEFEPIGGISGYHYKFSFVDNKIADINSYQLYATGNMTLQLQDVDGNIITSIQMGTYDGAIVDFPTIYDVATIVIFNPSTVETRTVYEFEIYGTLQDADYNVGIYDINLVPGDKTINVTWSYNGSTLLNGYNIYLDDVKINDVLITTNQYTIDNLINGQTYKVQLSAVDIYGNESILTTPLTATPMAPTKLPDKIQNVNVKALNGAISLDWPYIHDATGYNVYLDGVKHNNVPLQKNYYTIQNLNNDQSYIVQVSAINQLGEGELSDPISVTPSKNSLPVIKLGFTLSDLAESVSSWFSSIWLIVAFVSSIPIAFMIARRVKSIFIP